MKAIGLCGSLLGAAILSISISLVSNPAYAQCRPAWDKIATGAGGCAKGKRTGYAVFWCVRGHGRNLRKCGGKVYARYICNPITGRYKPPPSVNVKNVCARRSPTSAGGGGGGGSAWVRTEYYAADVRGRWRNKCKSNERQLGRKIKNGQRYVICLKNCRHGYRPGRSKNRRTYLCYRKCPSTHPNPRWSSMGGRLRCFR